jgi:hypothetical protein
MDINYANYYIVNRASMSAEMPFAVWIAGSKFRPFALLGKTMMDDYGPMSLNQYIEYINTLISEADDAQKPFNLDPSQQPCHFLSIKVLHYVYNMNHDELLLVHSPEVKQPIETNGKVIYNTRCLTKGKTYAETAQVRPFGPFMATPRVRPDDIYAIPQLKLKVFEPSVTMNIPKELK